MATLAVVGLVVTALWQWLPHLRRTPSTGSGSELVIVPPVDDDDPRFTRGKIYAIAADSLLALSVITGLTAVYYTFREKGPPSTAIIDVNALSVMPVVGPSYAGVGMEVSW